MNDDSCHCGSTAGDRPCLAGAARLAALMIAVLAGDAARAQAPDRPESIRKPPALLRLEQARRQVTSGRIDWEVIGAFERDEPYSYVSRYAGNGDVLLEKRGSRDGWVAFGRHADGAMEGYDRHPQLFMLNSEGWWEAKEGRPVTVNVWKQSEGAAEPAGGQRRREALDVLYAGISYSPRSLQFSDGFASLWHDEHHRVTRWHERAEGDRIVVTGETEIGSTLRWIINPAKGWNAEYIEVVQNGVAAGARCTLRQYDGVWLPEVTEYFVGDETRQVVRIVDAALNRPGDPKSFTPADLRIEPGAEVLARPLTPESPDLVWNGDGICTRQEWDADLKTGRRKRGPAGARMAETGFLESPYDTPEIRRKNIEMSLQLRSQGLAYGFLLLWHKHVNAFVDRYELAPDQIEKAWQIRRQCEELAREHIQRRSEEFREVADRLVTLRSDPGADRGRIAELDARLKRLQEPIDRIFAEQLVPRLDKLPTRAQRQKADEKAAEKAAQEAAAKAQAPASAPARR